MANCESKLNNVRLTSRTYKHTMDTVVAVGAVSRCVALRHTVSHCVTLLHAVSLTRTKAAVLREWLPFTIRRVSITSLLTLCNVTAKHDFIRIIPAHSSHFEGI